MISNSISNRAELRNFMTFDDFFSTPPVAIFKQGNFDERSRQPLELCIFICINLAIIAFPMRSRSGVEGVLWRFDGPINLHSRIAPARMGELLMAGEDVKCIVKLIVGAVKCSMPSGGFKGNYCSQYLRARFMAANEVKSLWIRRSKRLQHHHRRIICVAMREISMCSVSSGGEHAKFARLKSSSN